MTPSPLPVEVLDSGLDVAMFVVSLVAAVATAGAVIVAIVQVWHARRDVKLARQDAADARRDAKQELHLRLESERAQKLAADRAAAERRAERQAIDVVSQFNWNQLDADRIVSGDLHANTSVIVRNGSALPIKDVRVWQYCWIGDGVTAPRWYNPLAYPPATEIPASRAHEFLPEIPPAYVGNSRPPHDLVTVVEFMDFYRDRWRLDWNGDLTLLAPRRIDADTDSALEWAEGYGADGKLGRPPLPDDLPESYQVRPPES